MRIQVIRTTHASFRIDKKTLRSIERAASSLPRIHAKTEVNIIIASSQKSRALNKEYRKKNYTPDVLTFEYDGKDGVLGEMIIVPDIVKKQAKERGHSVQIEFTILAIHGIVHMLGYEHENVSASRKASMKRVEKKLLSKLGLTTTSWSY